MKSRLAHAGAAVSHRRGPAGPPRGWCWSSWRSRGRSIAYRPALEGPVVNRDLLTVPRLAPPACPSIRWCAIARAAAYPTVELDYITAGVAAAEGWRDANSGRPGSRGRKRPVQDDVLRVSSDPCTGKVLGPKRAHATAGCSRRIEQCIASASSEGGSPIPGRYERRCSSSSWLARGRALQCGGRRRARAIRRSLRTNPRLKGRDAR
jgi:hypothetical protein